jgi:DNA replication and repair protein RecF
MWVNSLEINNLRNIETARFEVDPFLNCFIGDNGAGKTSILEALVVLSKGRTFRTGQAASLIGPCLPYFRVISTVESQDKAKHRLGMERGLQHWTARHNGQDVTQLSELTHLLPHVLLEPNSHKLVSGPPEVRRKYLDWGVFHVERDFLSLWRRYTRVLKQRNAALRQSDQNVVSSLNPQLVSLGEQLHQQRQKYVGTLSTILSDTLPYFNKRLENVVLRYKKGWTGESLGVAITQSIQRDMDRGATGPGPHKADLSITAGAIQAKERLSRGEQKALTAALILTQARLMCESGEAPLLLLDDLASELDEEHLKKVLIAGLKMNVQIWMTGTTLLPAIETCGRSLAVFHVEHGKVAPV